MTSADPPSGPGHAVPMLLGGILPMGAPDLTAGYLLTLGHAPLHLKLAFLGISRPAINGIKTQGTWAETRNIHVKSEGGRYIPRFAHVNSH